MAGVGYNVLASILRDAPPPPQLTLPPPTAPSLPPGTMPIVEQLNRRFRAGQASNSLELAGVLMHQDDAVDVDYKPWLPVGEGEYSDRFPSSIINTRSPYIFSTSAAGVVGRPSALPDGIWCSCPFDCNSMGEPNHGCPTNPRHKYAADDLISMLRRGPPKVCSS
mgnify:CR=1 FL=1